MNLQQFLQKILPDSGNYFTVQITPTGQTRQFKHTDISQAVASLEHINLRHNHAYIATGSFKAKRTQDQVARKRVWYVDIDCKEGGQYTTKADAIAALKAAIKQGLPAPTIIVDSGNGYHLYWVIDDDVSKNEWKSLAKALDNACKINKLDIDPAVTLDEARILRAPETVNFKDPKNPKACTIVSDKGKSYTHDTFSKALNPYLVQPSVVPLQTGVALDDLTSGLHEGKKPKAQDMLSQCAVFNHAYATGGVDDSEPLWHSLLYTLSFCEDGKDFIHDISKSHPKYSQGQTERRFARYESDRADPNNNFGPTSCEKFSSMSEQCKSCEYHGKNLFKSPIKLGFGQVSLLPFPFRNNNDTLEMYEDDDTGWVKVFDFPITDFEATIDTSDGVTYYAFKVNNRQLYSNNQEFTSTKDITKVISSVGVLPSEFETRQIRALMSAWLTQLNKANNVREATGRQFGWTKTKGFHFGGTIYTTSGAEPAHGGDRNLIEVYSAHGVIDPWREACNHILSTPRHASWAMIASAFAAPLIVFTGVNGVIISIISQDSGSGKSSAMKVAQGVWGHPKKGAASLNDTGNAVMHRMGVLKNLPAYWDEVREKEEVTKFIKDLFRVSQGKEKERLTSNITARKSGDWDTIIGVGSNEPLRDHILQTIGNSDAGTARLFEIRSFPIKDNLSDAEARRMFSRLNDNYGNAGVIYSEWLANNREEAEKILHNFDEKLSKALDSENSERFWIATIASLMAGAYIANKLGLCQFDLKGLQGYLVGEFKRIRLESRAGWATPADRAVNVLNDYIYQTMDRTIKCDVMPKKGNAGTVLMDTIRPPAINRIAIDDKAIVINTKEFETWIYKQSGSGYSHVIDNLINSGAERKRITIDSGSAYSSGTRHWCLVFNLNKPDFKDLTTLCSAPAVNNTDLG